jgi:hypothetical protein
LELLFAEAVTELRLQTNIQSTRRFMLDERDSCFSVNTMMLISLVFQRGILYSTGGRDGRNVYNTAFEGGRHQNRVKKIAC